MCLKILRAASSSRSAVTVASFSQTGAASAEARPAFVACLYAFSSRACRSAAGSAAQFSSSARSLASGSSATWSESGAAARERSPPRVVGAPFPTTGSEFSLFDSRCASAGGAKPAGAATTISKAKLV